MDASKRRDRAGCAKKMKTGRFADVVEAVAPYKILKMRMYKINHRIKTLGGDVAPAEALGN